MSNGIVTSPSPHSPQLRQTEQLQEALSYRAESTDVRYTDADGRSFNLSLKSETTTYAMTYDRTAQVRGNAPGGDAHSEMPVNTRGRGPHREIRKELQELRGQFHDLEKSLKDSDIEVQGFKRLLHRMLKAVDGNYRERFRQYDPVESAPLATEQLHVEATAVEQTLTVSMDVVDPVYWNVENTAGRLVDFATGLYRGGDRGEHVDKMVEGMKRGYAEAAQAFGGTLPEIADDTIDLAVKLLEEWAADGATPEGSLDLVA